MPLDMRRLYLIFSLAVIVLSVLAGLLISGLSGDELGGRPLSGVGFLHLEPILPIW
jgi:hypothetical protein